MNLRIQSEYGKIWTERTWCSDTFHIVLATCMKYAKFMKTCFKIKEILYFNLP